MMSTYSITFLGDIYLGEDLSLELDAELTDKLRLSDYVVANLEAPITDIANQNENKVRLRSKPGLAGLLKSWGVDAVTVSNNHMFDSGLEGFNDTVKELDEVGIACFGAGANLDEALHPLIVSIKGTKVGFLVFSSEEIQTTCASKDSFGCAPFNSSLIINSIKALEDEVDSIIVCLHWGLSEYILPSPEQVDFANQLSKIPKVSAIIGHHSHVIQGVQIIEGTLVAFSLGNFAFRSFMHKNVNYRLSEDNKWGMLLQVMFDQRGRFVDYNILHSTFSTKMIEYCRSKKIQKEFNNRSNALVKSNYLFMWRCEAKKHLFKRLFRWANPIHLLKIRKEQIFAGWTLFKKAFGR